MRTRILALILILVAVQATAEPLEGPLLPVGDPALDGKRLGRYTAKWTQSVLREGEWTEVAVLTETARPTRRNGRAVLEHVQQTEAASGVQVENTMIFDHATLAPLKLSQQISGGPPQAPRERLFEFDGHKVRTRTTKADGQVEDAEAELASPMFYGMTFGLVLAALPLEEGYRAKLPVLMPQQGNTKYWIIARVVGRERFETGEGKTVEAWTVETDWADFDSGEVTSEGGAKKAGGAYSVVTDPPAGFPYVPRYANENVVIEVAL